MEDFKAIGKRLSNWGRWGADDQRGTLNFITPEKVRAAASSIRSGKVFELSLPLGMVGPQQGTGRFNPIHAMTILPGEFTTPDGLVVSDDMLTLPLQCASQWDSLAHVGYDDRFYNDVIASAAVTARGGASRNSIEAVLPGAVGRGVLLDLARLRGVDWISAEDDPITVAELERAEAAQGVRVGSGDALLFRTGWRRKSLVEGWTPEWLAANPGLALECAQWICEREISIVAADNWGVEIQPSRTAGAFLPLHCVLLRDVGMMFGEMFDLEALAEDCAADGQWDFFFSGPPLRVVGGVGSVANPVAVK
ncbi:cyclase family protein [Frankia sp. AgKG'84/4]|uniref:cyclase family protein n=1 Tax=Frankia sp. AgKG'84/4 TaxID=573490 RepID=UPI00202A6970|nr:cyclase family protein [Frankia sp. AgKG'84/4]MCL9793181.1 cyclase family protein [Frankia sp. AgKG'84/4]